MKEEKQNKIKFGVCPHCSSGNYDCPDTNFVTHTKIPYVIADCHCYNCDKSFTEYYGLDEVGWEDEEENKCYATNTLSPEEKELIASVMEAHKQVNQDKEKLEQIQKIIKIMKGELIEYS